MTANLIMNEKLRQYAQQISQLYPVRELSSDQQDELLANGQMQSVSAGQYLFHQGDNDNAVYYLMSGAITLDHDKQFVKQIIGASTNANIALAQLQPRKYSAKADTDCEILCLPREQLEATLSHREGNQHKELEVNDLNNPDSLDWENRLLNSTLFEHVPVINIHRIFTLIESRSVKQGEHLIEQDEKTDTFYILQEGTCQISRKAHGKTQHLPLARIIPGDCFDTQALVIDEASDARHAMITNGRIGSIPQRFFIELILKPALNSVTLKSKDHDKPECVWLDVRHASEISNPINHQSLNIPLNLLRFQTDKLARETTYYVCCNNGKRSAAAVLLLLQKGFKVRYLEGGTDSLSTSTKETSKTTIIKTDKVSVAHKSRVKQKQTNSTRPKPKQPSAKPSSELILLRKSLKIAKQRLLSQRSQINQVRSHSDYQLKAQRQELESKLHKQARELRESLEKRQQVESELLIHNEKLELQVERMRQTADRSVRRDELLRKRLMHKADRLIAEELGKLQPHDEKNKDSEAEDLISHFLRDKF